MTWIWRFDLARTGYSSPLGSAQEVPCRRSSYRTNVRSQRRSISPAPGTDDRPVVEAPADDGRVIATSWRSVLPTAAELLRARRRLHGKSILIALLLAGSYWAVVLSELGWPFRLLGGASLVVGLVALATGVMHDGNHGSFSRHAWLNHVAGYSLDALGGSSWLWRFKHNTLHHGNPNVEGVDSDISQAPFARLAPMQPLASVAPVAARLSVVPVRVLRLEEPGVRRLPHACRGTHRSQGAAHQARADCRSPGYSPARFCI